ncbi:ABC transporter permease [Thermocatellispora tengchongensis]
MWGVRLGVVAAFVLVWYLAGALEWMSPVFISDPASVAGSLAGLVVDGGIWADGWATLSAALTGLAIGAATGVASGLLLGEFALFRRAVQPIVTLANALPRPALAPIFLVWFGLGAGAKIAVSVSVVYFLLLINTLAGVDGVDADRATLARTLGMSRLQRFRLLQLPSAGPAILAGLRLGSVYSVLGVVVAEMVASTEGLGLRLVQATNQFDIAGSFAILFLLALLAFVLDWTVGRLERRLSWGTSPATL